MMHHEEEETLKVQRGVKIDSKITTTKLELRKINWEIRYSVNNHGNAKVRES